MKTCVGYTLSVMFLGCGSAFAAPPTHDWSGLYIGANAGVALSGGGIDPFNYQIDQFSGASIPGLGVVNVPATTGRFPGISFSDDYFVGGGQVGYAFTADNWVFGAEGEFRLGGTSSSAAASVSLPQTTLQAPSLVTVSRSFSNGYNSSLRGRAGYSWDDFLAYGTAGIALAHFKVAGTGTFVVPAGIAAPCPSALCGPSGVIVINNPVTTTTSGKASADRIGWTLGGGVEWAWTENISLGFEYRHSDFGSVTVGLPANLASSPLTFSAPVGASPTTISGQAQVGPTAVRFMEDAVTARLNFRIE